MDILTFEPLRVWEDLNILDFTLIPENESEFKLLLLAKNQENSRFDIHSYIYPGIK